MNLRDIESLTKENGISVAIIMLAVSLLLFVIGVFIQPFIHVAVILIMAAGVLFAITGILRI